MEKIEDLEKEDKEERENQLKWEEKIYKLEVEKKAILEQLRNDNKELKDVIINFFKNKK